MGTSYTLFVECDICNKEEEFAPMEYATGLESCVGFDSLHSVTNGQFENDGDQDLCSECVEEACSND